MKVTGLPFKGPMIRALLREVQLPDTGKTQTRRVLKKQPLHGTAYHGFERSGHLLVRGHVYERITCPYGNPGDLIYVRETMRVIDVMNYGSSTEAIRVRYEADGAESDWIKYPERLDSSPKVGQCLAYGGFREASRLTLPLKEVRVQQIQEISEADAKAEGLSCITKDSGRTLKYGIPDRDGLPGTDDTGWPWSEWSTDPRIAFQKLWDSINGPRGYGFDKKPWVFALTFSIHLKNVNYYMREAA